MCDMEESPVLVPFEPRQKTSAWNDWGVKWRSSIWFITLVVTLGTTTDALAYSIVVPVLPFRLEHLGYTNVSSLTSWLLFAYSGGVVILTPLVAHFFARRPYRRGPLAIAMLILQLGLVLFMVVKPYEVMVIARFLQGAASTVVFIVGFALICENVEEKHIGRQLGFAMAGVPVGVTIGPPIGGALYSKLGWNGPFVFTIILCAIDLFLRLLVVEQKDVPESQLVPVTSIELATDSEKSLSEGEISEHLAVATVATTHVVQRGRKRTIDPKDQLSILGVLAALIKSKRGLAACLVNFASGFFIGAIDPTIALRLQHIWHKDADFVGIAFLAAAAPSFIAAPLAGELADKFGAEWFMAPCMIVAAPFLALIISKYSLAAVIVYMSVAITALNCALAPGGLEVALAAREVDGMSEMYQFAALQLAYSVAQCVGGIVGGQLYDHVSWSGVCWVIFGFTCLCIPVPFVCSGNWTLWDRLLRRNRPAPVE